MQNAPSVIYPVGHSAFYRSSLVVLGAAALLLFGIGWFTSWASSPWRTSHLLWAGGLGVWLIWVSLVWFLQPVKPKGFLHWNAQAIPVGQEDRPGAWMWRWEDAIRSPAAVRIVLVLDGQSRILLRLHGLPSLGRWMWLERAYDPSRWDDLRRAVTAHGASV